MGNEIVDVQFNQNNGFHRLRTMLNFVDKYDPTRSTTLVNQITEISELRHFDYYDIHSWNYDQRWDTARKLEPNKPVIISDRINISVDGAAKIAGVGNGNPQSFEPFQAEFVDLFYGKAMIILRSTQERGEVEVSVSSDDLEGDLVKIDVE